MEVLEEKKEEEFEKDKEESSQDSEDHGDQQANEDKKDQNQPADKQPHHGHSVIYPTLRLQTFKDPSRDKHW